MSDTLYNARQYVRFTLSEFIAILTTSIITSAILCMRELLFVYYGEAQGFQILLLTFLFITAMLFVAVWLCKIVGIRMGHVISYRAHHPGLGIGFVLSFMSQGWLPVFLPGGFTYEQPERLRIGKWLGQHKGWEIGLVSGSFILVMLLFALVFSPLYLYTKADVYAKLLLASCLFAIWACLPVPFFQSKNRGAWDDYFRYTHGCTFGLDLAFSSPSWYVVLCCTVLFFSMVAYLLTILSISAGLALYGFSLIIGALGLWVYTLFFKERLHKL